MPTLIEWPAANPLLPPTALKVLREDLCGRQRRPQRLGVGLILHLCNSIWRNLRQYKVLFVVSLCQICKYSSPERLEEPYIQLYPCISKYTTINTRHVTQEFFFFQRHKYYDRIQKDSKGVSFVNTKLFLWVCTDREINEGEYISLLDDVKKAFASFRKRSRSVFMRIKHCFELCLEQTVRLFLVLTFIAIVERN